MAEKRGDRFESSGFGFRDERTLVERAPSHGPEITQYSNDIAKAVERQPELLDSREVRAAGALMRLTAIRLNSIWQRLPGPKDHGYYHGDGPFDTMAVREALPDLIENFGRQLSDDQIDQAIAKLSEARSRRGG